MNPPQTIDASRIVVVMPNWLGDGVMATPFLRALRTLYPHAHIAAVARPLVAPVLAGLGVSTTEAQRHGERGWVDEVKVCDKGEERAIARWMRNERFDLGVLLPNSFRSAWMLWRGGVRRRLGYNRGFRRPLLTDSLPTRRRSLESFRDQKARYLFRNYVAGGDFVHGTGELIAVEPAPSPRFYYLAITRDRSTGERSSNGTNVPEFGHRLPWGRGWQPIPTIRYYLKLAEFLGAPADAPPPQMQLAVTPDETRDGRQALSLAGIGVEDRIVTMVPGANFGASKCWLPERFAQVADRLADPAGPFAAKVILAGSPAESPIIDAILAASQHPDRLISLPRLNDGRGVSLGALKEIVRRSSLMVCNDTGPRHFAAAFGIPLVTLFGPTDPVWAETFAPNERILRIDVPCGPCQLKKCPIDHRCMYGITVDMVLSAVQQLWPARAPAP